MDRPYRSKRFLTWARERSQGVTCCVCGVRPAVDLHHIEVGGMGLKCSDLLVCRVCRDCHGCVQGKGRLAMHRLGEHWAGVYDSMMDDNRELIEGYIRHLENK